MKKLVMRWTASMMSIILLLAFGGTVTAAASVAEVTSQADNVSVRGYEVTNETITPGSEFILTIHIHNYSELTASPEAKVVVINPDGVIPEYGSISEAVIGEVEPGADTSVSFRYSAESTIEANYLDFTVGISAETIISNSQIRIPVGRTTDFEAENVTVPTTFAVDRPDYVSANVTNLSMTGISNTVMVARCDGEDIASTRIGTMVAGTNKTETLSVSFAQEGEYQLDLVLTYTNQDGENKEYMITSTIITVTDETEISSPTENVDNTNMDEQTTDTQDGIAMNHLILICVCGFLLIAVCCVALIIIYKRK